MLRSYKYNELAYAELIYKNGFQTTRMQSELNLLAAYAKHELGMKPAARKEFLYEFCHEHIDGFRREVWFRQINRALNYSNKKQSVLSRITQIDITQGELDYILGLDVPRSYQKVFFAFLVQMKLNMAVSEFKNGKPYDSTFFRGDKTKYNAIKKMANAPTALDMNGEFVHEMFKAGLIEVLFNGLIRHKWMDDCRPSGDVAIEVRDFENVGWYLDYHLGAKGMKLCKHCEQPFRASSKDRLYCSKHKEYAPKAECREIICCDCGTTVFAHPKATRTVRCTDCQTKFNKEADRKRKSAKVSS